MTDLYIVYAEHGETLAGETVATCADLDEARMVVRDLSGEFRWPYHLTILAATVLEREQKP